MDKKQLISSAEKLVQPSKNTFDEYESKKDMLAEKMNQIMIKRNDIKKMVGDNISMMEDNHRNHARFMASLFRSYNAEIFVDTVLWVYRAYRSHGFSLIYWPAQLDSWLSIMKSELNSSTYNEIYPFYNWMIINQAYFVELSDHKLDEMGESLKH
ncbi:MAG: hypothetical protein KKB34_03290 [Bacteroidetes bacterium]|jgi:hypothetical protein|nr:hypothetical protein [Bacteroidota bacterium]